MKCNRNRPVRQPRTRWISYVLEVSKKGEKGGKEKTEKERRRGCRRYLRLCIHQPVKNKSVSWMRRN